MIAHIDMDAFFAKCEELRNPEIKGKPVVICVYTRGKTSGAVSTSNYRARELGIESAMPLSEARKKATDETVFLPVDHDYYRQKSKEVISILRDFSPEIQKTSIDEAYFRLETEQLEKAEEIQEKVRKLGLTASIGIAPNKFLAKMCSEEDKPDGLRTLEEDEVEDFLSGREVGELHGVGDRTSEKLEEIGIEKVDSLRKANASILVEKFGRSKAASLKNRALGKGSTSLESDRQKQISKIKTMGRNSKNLEYIKMELEKVADLLIERVERKNKAFQKVGLIAIDTDLETHTRSRSLKTSDSVQEILENAEELLEDLMEKQSPEIRRIGLRVSKLVDRESQTSLRVFGN